MKASSSSSPFRLSAVSRTWGREGGREGGVVRKVREVGTSGGERGREGTRAYLAEGVGIESLSFRFFHGFGEILVGDHEPIESEPVSVERERGREGG